MGLRDTHPEKEGVLVDLKNLSEEVKARLDRKAQRGATAVSELVEKVEGLEVLRQLLPRQLDQERRLAGRPQVYLW